MFPWQGIGLAIFWQPRMKKSKFRFRMKTFPRRDI
jgi:hypothetical protein